MTDQIIPVCNLSDVPAVPSSWWGLAHHPRLRRYRARKDVDGRPPPAMTRGAPDELIIPSISITRLHMSNAQDGFPGLSQSFLADCVDKLGETREQALARRQELCNRRCTQINADIRVHLRFHFFPVTMPRRGPLPPSRLTSARYQPVRVCPECRRRQQPRSQSYTRPAPSERH